LLASHRLLPAFLFCRPVHDIHSHILRAISCSSAPTASA
jgi:hypothetical protein